MSLMRIVALLTCHNRREKTERCLRSLIRALRKYNQENPKTIELEVYMTDDGCTDGTSDAVRLAMGNEIPLKIFQGDGNLFWAGGMRFCWKEAMKEHQNWDYYLLLNDDVDLNECLFEELFVAQAYSKDKYGMEGIVSGITCASKDKSKMTYGGDVWINRFLATTRRLRPTGQPQLCDLTNANVMFVPVAVVDKIGIFNEGYHHGIADYDYSNSARKAGIPVVLTANFCGICDNDHPNKKDIADKVVNMSLKERKDYFKSPIHSSADYLYFVSRTSPIRVPMVWLGRLMNLYCPKLYYGMDNKRN